MANPKLLNGNTYSTSTIFSGALIPKAESPLDKRTVVDSYDDLFKYSTWILGVDPNYYYTLYPGVSVWVTEKAQRYTYIGAKLSDTAHCLLVKDAVIDSNRTDAIHYSEKTPEQLNTDLETAKDQKVWIPQVGFFYGVFTADVSAPAGDGYIAQFNIDGSTSFKISCNGSWVTLGATFDAAAEIAKIKRELGTVYTYKGSYEYLTAEHKASDPDPLPDATVAVEEDTFAIGDVVNITKAGPNFPAGTNFAYVEKEAEIPVLEWQGGTDALGDPGTKEYPRWKDSNHTVVLNLVPEWDSLGGNFNPGQIKADVTESIAGGTVNGNSIVNTTVYKDGDTGYNTYVTNNTFEAPSGFTGSGNGPYTKTDSDVTTTITVTQDPTTKKLVVTVTETHVLHDCTSNNSDGLDGITLVNINAELGHLDTRLSGIESRVGTLETTVSGHTTQIGTDPVYYTRSEYNTANGTELDEAAFAVLPAEQKIKIAGTGIKEDIRVLQNSVTKSLTWG